MTKMNSLLEALSKLPADARILDAGGWYNPHPLATHIADLFPYETRQCRLNESPLPGERFSKLTWFQCDFLDPEFKIPVADKYFDFSICTHTLEDLREPTFLIRELDRTCKAGYIETPSRLMEQTIGISNREAKFQGFNHHKWIVDLEADSLLFFDKDESLFDLPARHCIPLYSYERYVKTHLDANSMRLLWSDEISFRISKSGDIARQKAMEYRSTIPVSQKDIAIDTMLRFARRIRSRIRGLSHIDSSEAEIRKLSEKYSEIRLD